MTTEKLLTIIGNNVKNARLKMGLRQVNLADSCNMEKASISRIESGKTNITLATLNTIASNLNMEAIDLLPVAALQENAATD